MTVEVLNPRGEAPLALTPTVKGASGNVREPNQTIQRHRECISGVYRFVGPTTGADVSRYLTIDLQSTGRFRPPKTLTPTTHTSLVPG